MQEPNQTIQTRYEALQGYNVFTRWLHSIRYRHILSVIEEFATCESPRRPVRILDIGCGPAKLYRILNERFPIEYLGCEIQAGFIEVARARHGNQPNFRITDQSITSGNISLHDWDIIVALETLEHIPEHYCPVKFCSTMISTR